MGYVGAGLMALAGIFAAIAENPLALRIGGLIVIGCAIVIAREIAKGGKATHLK